MAIVALGVASALLVTLMRAAMDRQRRAEVELWEVQADCLAASGLERAAARLAKDKAYRGEVWHLPADSLGTRHAAVVTIEVLAGQTQPGGRAVRVRADYPDHAQHHVRRSKHAMIGGP